MATRIKPDGGSLAIAELKEFASFDAASQRYIRRSLDVAFGRADALALWSRDMVERAGILTQSKVYTVLPEIRMAVPGDSGLEPLDPFLGKLIRITAFDLGQGRLSSFGAYRFLYERLVGSAARPWFPSAFCASATLPHLHPTRRKALLQSISEAAATAPGWSGRAPVFYPEWVEKVDCD